MLNRVESSQIKSNLIESDRISNILPTSESKWPLAFGILWLFRMADLAFGSVIVGFRVILCRKLSFKLARSLARSFPQPTTLQATMLV